ncbi:hypothetical protein PG996_003313 [Apiospora saccharicola]|uniref:Uncharacterized protein n=1 Tax=Apiospora saccharicola TaxID=335842 RepID=A0ABR1W0Y4_9PEZI
MLDVFDNFRKSREVTYAVVADSGGDQHGLLITVAIAIELLRGRVVVASNVSRHHGQPRTGAVDRREESLGIVSAESSDSPAQLSCVLLVRLGRSNTVGWCALQ